jgi:hypothetical protein
LRRVTARCLILSACGECGRRWDRFASIRSAMRHMERRLGQIERFSGMPEATLLGDRTEHLEPEILHLSLWLRLEEVTANRVSASRSIRGL